MDDELTTAELVRALTAAAKASGAVRDNDGKPTAAQSAFSLAWYFEHLLQRDLDHASDSYSPLLDAYLHGNANGLVTCLDRGDAIDDAIDPSLNPNQRCAVQMALNNPLTIIVGPPGTGKTRTILRILALAVERGESVAMVSSNHSAVNNVVEKVEEARGSADGSPVARLADHFVALGNARDRRKADLGFSTSAGKGKPKAHEDLALGWEQNIRLDEFCKTGETGARCITSTIHSLKKCFVDGDRAKYDLVVIDEASQASVLLGIVAMSSARRLVVVGDDEQLPPVIAESLARELADKIGPEAAARLEGTPFDVANAGMPMSFLGSLGRVFGVAAARVMLTEHYRCHKAIIGFCNDHVYDKALKIKTEVAPDAPAFPIGVRWYDGDYREPDVRWEQDKNKPGMYGGTWRSSVCNQRQLSIIVREELPHIRELVAAEKSICFLSPFWAQVEALGEVLRRVDPDIARELGFGLDPDGDDGESADTGQDPVIPALTVHRSQGREYDCVYLLPVEDGKWEWPWSQGRRLVNVAVSRAKEELHVIVSTKLMLEEDQRALTGRAYKADVAASEQDDRENLFVCKLVHYVMEREAEWSQPGQPSWCGMHRTRVASVFDWSANLLGGLGDDDAAGGQSWVPETLVTCGLAHMDVPGAAGGIALARNVPLSKLLLGGGGLDVLAGERFKNPRSVHFDFVVVERDTRRVLALVEADGQQHRFMAYKDPDTGRRRSRAGALQAAERDWQKERLVRELGGTCAWLGEPGAHQLVKAAVQGKARRLIPGDKTFEGEDAPEGESRLVGWACAPGEVAKGSKVLFLRLPNDGSTSFEFDAIRDGEGEPPATPSLDELVRAQLERMGDDEGMRLDDSVRVFYAGRTRKTISAIAAPGAAKDANALLVGRGILRDDKSVGGRRPTALGEYLGIALEDAQPGKDYRLVTYDSVAEHAVGKLLR